jgi:aspartyl protease family protein
MGINNLSQGDWQNLVYLLIVLVFLSSGFLSRSSLGIAKIAKYFAIWSAIGLIAIIFYSYRFEFQGLKNRVLGEINPSQAQINEKGNLVINISQDGHFYVNSKVNGAEVRFMIDTGASQIMLNRKEAKRIGFDLEKLNFNRQYQTANGISWGANVTLDSVEIEGIKFSSVSASINDADMGTSLLGMSFLRRFKKYEFYQDRLELTL